MQNSEYGNYMIACLAMAAALWLYISLMKAQRKKRQQQLRELQAKLKTIDKKQSS